MIRENHVFVFVLVTVGFMAATLILNVREPLKDPIQAQPLVTSTAWKAPVITSSTVTPTLKGGDAGWWSNLPTPVPVKTRWVAPTAKPTNSQTPKR